MGHGAWGKTLLPFALCAMRKIKEVAMSEEVRIYTTPMFPYCKIATYHSLNRLLLILRIY